MKKFLFIAAAAAAIASIAICITACDTTAAKSALAQAGTLAYTTAGRAKLESWLSDQVSSGKLTEAQKAEALAAADQGVEKLAAYLESASQSPAATDTSGTK